jgi:predicted transcriptional regulator of viral defense system
MNKIILTDVQKRIIEAIKKHTLITRDELQTYFPDVSRGELNNDIIRLVDRGEIKINQDFRMEIGSMDLWP